MIDFVLLFAISAVAVIFALFQRFEHTYLIKHHIMTYAKKKAWTGVRLGLFGTICLAWAAMGAFPWPDSIFLFVGIQAGFSFLFRHLLNEEMGWDIDYLGSTSIYDITMIRISLFIHKGTWLPSKDIQLHHQGAYIDDRSYREIVHCGGKIASGAELSVYAASVLICLIG